MFYFFVSLSEKNFRAIIKSCYMRTAVKSFMLPSPVFFPHNSFPENKISSIEANDIEKKNGMR